MSLAYGPGLLGDADVALAQTLARLWPGAATPHLLLAALAQRAVSTGDTCLDLDRLDPESWREDARFAGDDPASIRAAAQSAPFVGAPGSELPLVRDGARRVYLRRYHAYETRVAAELLRRAAAPPVDVPADRVAEILGPAQDLLTDWQRVALALAARRRLVVLCGGPGTGKTWTIAQLVVVWRRLHGEDFRIALAAPTGKAAARLAQALPAGMPGGTPPAQTLHRLLGQRPLSTVSERDARNPLALDALVVDECSMVDLPLMARLLDALPPQAQLVLVGDPDQLPAVETGAVLHALAEHAPESASSPGQAEWLERATGAAVPRRQQPPLDDAFVHLVRRHRFEAQGAIGMLLDHVRRGDADAALAHLGSGENDALRWIEPSRHTPEALRQAVAAGFASLQRAREPATALGELAKFRVLCALREGPSGAGGLNPWIARRVLRPAARVHPVLIVSNDPATGLFNGDVGVAMDESDQVWFESPEGPRPLARIRLPGHEEAFAMTVHKAQGSEFDEVAVVLPPHPHPLLTRAWLYTALSRARERVTVCGEAPVLRAAVLLRGARASGLLDRLASPS